MHAVPARCAEAPAQGVTSTLHTPRCRGDFGRLGHGDCADVFIPRRIACLAENTVKSVTCGDTHTLAVLNDGRLFSFGRNQNGQLGNGTSDDCLEARMVSNLAAETVTGAACGAEHSVCVTASGKVYSWGWGRYGNLGVGSFVDECAPRCHAAPCAHPCRMPPPSPNQPSSIRKGSVDRVLRGDAAVVPHCSPCCRRV